ncbi:MAG: dockerin type I domain-containing protein [Phycisphaerales bacterium]|nr:dockerin type I domain-containing protein [Phycisphaerales bacterium]
MHTTCTNRIRTTVAAIVSISMAWPTSSALARPGGDEPPMYTLLELGHLDPGSQAGSVLYGISDPTAAGTVVVGESFNFLQAPTLSWRATAWRPDVSLIPVDLLTPAQAGNSSVNRAQDVSPNGEYIVGYSNMAPPRGKRWTFNPATGAVTNVQTLNMLAGDGASEAVGVNSAGRAVGYSLTDSSTTRGAMWAPGNDTAILLTSPAGSGGFRLAREISEEPDAYIVGRCDMSSTPTTRPIIWKKSGGGPDTYGLGQLLDLLSPMEVHDAVGISPDGTQAVGLGALGGAATGVGWNTTTNDATSIGTLCCSQNVVYDINHESVGVGYVGLAFDVFRAVLFWNGQAYDLNERIVNVPQIGDSLFLHVATGINSEGQIVGKFGGFASGEPLSPGRIFILTPVPEQNVPGDVNGDGVVNIADLLAVISAWGQCPPAPCPADVNNDGFVNIGDLLFVISSWG